TDAPWMREAVESVLIGPDVTVRHVVTGSAVRAAVHERAPEIAVVDLQIGNMGGMAVCLDLRLEESGGRVAHVPVLMLLAGRPDSEECSSSKLRSWGPSPCRRRRRPPSPGRRRGPRSTWRSAGRDGGRRAARR